MTDKRFATPADKDRKFVIFHVDMSEFSMKIAEDEMWITYIGHEKNPRFGGWGAIDKVPLGEPCIHSWSSFSYRGYIIDYAENRDAALKRAKDLIQLQKTTMLKRLAATTDNINNLELVVM